MTRIGPWVFIASMTVLCAGIVSTRSEGWKKPEKGSVNIPLDLQGAVSLDIDHEGLGTLKFTNKPARVHIEWWYWDAMHSDTKSLIATREGNRVTLDAKQGYLDSSSATVDIPQSITSLSAPLLSVDAKTKAGAMQIESFSLRWVGDAQSLDLRINARHATLQQTCRATPDVTFHSGEVGALRISIERGELGLGDLSRVGRVEIHAGPDVTLAMNRIEDLKRITLLPFDGEATAPPDKKSAECRLLPSDDGTYGFD